MRASGDVAGVIAAWGEAAQSIRHDRVFDIAAPEFAHFCRRLNDINIEIWEVLIKALPAKMAPELGAITTDIPMCCSTRRAQCRR